jgi:hypothetical protein
MKLLNVAIWCFCAILTVRAHAQEPPVPAAEAPSDNKEFNQDLDDFEKNISKEVPPTKAKPAAPPVSKKAAAAAAKAKKKAAAAKKKKAAAKKKAAPADE